MSEDLNQIKDDLLAANQTITTAAETAVKIDADVEALHAKIDALPVNPDAAAIQEMKDLGTLRANTASLKDALVATDEKTRKKKLYHLQNNIQQEYKVKKPAW